MLVSRRASRRASRFAAAAVALAGVVGCAFPYEVGSVEDGSAEDASPPPTEEGGQIFPTDDAGVETCSANTCGGCSVLSGEPGDLCEGCGTLACDGPDGVICTRAGKNACGGCKALAAAPGTSCAVGCGTVVCDGLDAVKCSGATTPNACGGCTPLTNAPGTSCSVGTACNGVWTCSGTERLTCTGGTAVNACGGCGTLTAAPNTPCPGSACGLYKCSADKTRVSCVEASPAAGSFCGVRCTTSRYVCEATTGTTTCQTPDEATLTDTANETNNTDANGLCRLYQKAVSFNVKHQGRITSFSLRMKRMGCLCAPCGTNAGSVVVALFAGAVGDVSKPLGSGSVATASILDGWNVFAIPTGVVVANGTLVWARISYNGDREAFHIYSSTTKPAGQSMWLLNSAGPSSFSPYANIRVEMRACTN